MGGRPSFTRNSAGLFTTQEGEVDSAIVNTPRFDWATLNLPNSLTERRKVLTLELARPNKIAYSDDFTQWSVGGSTTIVAGQPDPFGGTAASQLSANTAAANFSRAIVAFSADGTKAISLYVRQGNVAAFEFSLFDGTASVQRHLVKGTWTGGVPVLTTSLGSGTRFPVEALTGGWFRISFSAASVVAANTNYLYIYPGTTASTGFQYFCGAQADDGPFATAHIRTAGSVITRATDSLYWNFPPVPQAMMGYFRFVEQGTILTTPARVFEIGAAASVDERLLLDVNSGFYRIFHGQAGNTSSALAAVGAIGDTVELVPIVFADGSVQLIQSINGAAVTSSAQSGALAFTGSWSDTRLWLNSVGSGSNGSNKFAEIKLVKYADVVASTAQGRMDEMRAFELGPNADVL